MASRSPVDRTHRSNGGLLAPSSVGRAPALLIAAGEPRTRRFLRLTGQKSTNPPASPGGKVDPGETPRDAARRELFEETGIRAPLLPVPAAVTVRSYHPDWAATVGVTFLQVLDRRMRLNPEEGQPAARLPLDEPWQGWFAEDRLRMQECAEQILKA